MEGNEVFEKIKYIVFLLGDNGVEIIWVDKVIKDLKVSKRYLKIDYKMYISSEERCKDYCIIFFFSDLSNVEFFEFCNYNYDFFCYECLRFINVIEEVIVKLNDECIYLINDLRVCLFYE